MVKKTIVYNTKKGKKEGGTKKRLRKRKRGKKKEKKALCALKPQY